MAETEELVLEIEKQSIRGRACPRCAGKIIPSDRAVYQSAGGSNEVFPLWQCERCGYEQLSAKTAEAAKAGKPASAGKESQSKAVTAAAPATAAPMLDAKGRILPRDVQGVLERMRQQRNNS
jgi:hypothetical protein